MDAAHDGTDGILDAMEKRLTGIYKRANKDLGKTWRNYLEKAGKEIEELQKAYDLAKAGGDKDDIKSAGIKLSRAKRERTLLDEHYKSLSNQLAAQVSHVNETALALVNGKLPEIYALNYNSLKDVVDGLGGYSFELVDRNVIKNLASKDENLLPYKYVDGVEDVRWNVKKINSEVLQGILLGEPMDRIADRFQNVLAMNEQSAIRNARTTVTNAENKGRQDSYERASKDGIILEKQWMATNDSRTRHWHDALDGVSIPIDESFENVIQLSKHKRQPDKIRYPGDPEAHPSNVYNCRCTMVANVKGFKKILSPEQMEGVKIKVDGRPIEPVAVNNLFGKFADRKLNKELSKMDTITAQKYRDAIIKADKEFTDSTTAYSSIKNVINYNKDEYKDMEGWVAIHETTHYLDFNKKLTVKVDYADLVTQRNEKGFALRDKNGKIIKKVVHNYVDEEVNSVSSYIARKYDNFEDDYKSVFKVIGCDSNASANDKFDAFMKKRKEWIEKYGSEDIGHVTDVISGITLDEFETSLVGGHSKDYWMSDANHLYSEALASYSFLKATGRTDLLKLEKSLIPKLYDLLEEGYKKLWE